MAEDRIRDYIIEGLIGAGGMGMVYLAHHETLKRPAAIKVLLENLSAKPEIKERFVQEAQLMGALSHPNIVTLYDFTTTPKLSLIMEFVDGRGLDEMIGKEVGPIPWEKALPLFIQILEGIGYAHSKNVIHRDIKPANILVSKEGTVKITDLGIAKIAGQQGMTRTGAQMGTLYYESPEQIQGARDVDLRSDIYSLGMTLYEMLAGRLPFEGGSQTSEFAIMSSVVHRKDDLDPREYYPHIPEWLVEIVQKATAIDPEHRFQNCASFISFLEKYSNLNTTQSTYWSNQVESVKTSNPIISKPISFNSPSTTGSISANKCPSCNADIEKNMKFCDGCGEKLFKTCPKCKGEIRWNKKFCPECGADYEEANITQTSIYYDSTSKKNNVKTKSNKVEVFFTNKTNIKASISIDENHVVNVDKKETISVFTDSGSHSIKVVGRKLNGRYKLNFDLIPGNAQYFTLERNFGWMFLFLVPYAGFFIVLFMCMFSSKSGSLIIKPTYNLP